MLQPCSCGILTHVLDPSVPFVWVQRHVPFPRIQWDQVRLQLSPSGVLHDVEVRSLQFDLLFSTTRFLELLPEFEDFGITLFQMSRRVPDTLTLAGLTGDAVDRILVQNGLYLRFDLPHAREFASISAPRAETLEAVLQIEAVRQIAYTRKV